MKVLKVATLSIILGLTGCAELTEINQQLANWAGEQIKMRDANKQEISGSFMSKRDIDTLYARIKREFDFQTIEESLNGCNTQLNTNCRWKEMAIREGGYVYEKTPGVYYKLGHAVGKESFYVEITLAKEGRKTLVSYETRGSKAWANEVKSRLQKTIK
ncbi:hypothetical protein QJU87_04330 [Pasteurella skyensis]|uniref:hypothetical protein n=1 Tax=Phocoenobacter skyensis TaxID=97481 RepID=UPI00277AC77C|nr:hypothetical protein [Pasteurella skyensis]MDP8189092.1 hypothetical protein [Pasteurella skyensis]